MKPRNFSNWLRKTKPKQTTGFTFIELVMVIVILAIVSVIVAPKFVSNSIFVARGFADQILSTLRYAQKTAIAQHQNVCVNLAASSLTLTMNATCSLTLNLADRQSNVLTAPAGVTLTSSAATITFNDLGQPSTGATITVSGATTVITVEMETGYVHQ
jgi:MSHA pilin protein MshC